MIDSMLERIREIWARLRPDPSKTSLGWWMVAIHVAIVLLVGGGISYSAIRMLHDLADEPNVRGKAIAHLLADGSAQALWAANLVVDAFEADIEVPP